MTVFDHRILVNPQNRPQALYALRLVILYEIAYEETFTLRLNKSVVTLSRAGCSATCGTNRSSFVANDWVTARTFQLQQVKCDPIPQIEVLIEFVPWWLHVIKDVEAPINRVMVVRMLI